MLEQGQGETAGVATGGIQGLLAFGRNRALLITALEEQL